MGVWRARDEPSYQRCRPVGKRARGLHDSASHQVPLSRLDRLAPSGYSAFASPIGASRGAIDPARILELFPLD